jgi:hypothetical protein
MDGTIPYATKITIAGQPIRGANGCIVKAYEMVVYDHPVERCFWYKARKPNPQ